MPCKELPRPPLRIWINPTLASKSRKRERNDVLYIHEVVALSRNQKRARIHDHFNGSAHCIECEGQCQLTGADRLVTNLIRFIFEQWASGYCTPSLMLTETLKESDIDFEHFKTRAKETRNGN
jgi:hypothetical protein